MGTLIILEMCYANRCCRGCQNAKSIPPESDGGRRKCSKCGLDWITNLRHGNAGSLAIRGQTELAPLTLASPEIQRLITAYTYTGFVPRIFEMFGAGDTRANGLYHGYYQSWPNRQDGKAEGPPGETANDVDKDRWEWVQSMQGRSWYEKDNGCSLWTI